MTTATPTAPTAPTTDLQSLFTTILAKQWAQAECSMDTSDSMCAYRGTEGRACAVGCLIPDTAYDKCAEGAIVADVMRLADGRILEYRTPSTKALQAMLLASGLTPDTFPLLSALQKVHDDEPNPHAWPAKWEAVAEAFGLTMPVLGPMGGVR